MLAVPWKLECYLDARGNNSVEEFIEALPVADHASLRGADRFPRGDSNRAREPLSKSLGNGLFELRVKACRIFYCFKPGGVIVLLHGFMKKSQKTPRREMAIAQKRMEEV